MSEQISNAQMREELLDALEELLSEYKKHTFNAYCEMGTDDAVIANAEATIAKARGKV